jgi:3-dehydroquinate synthase
VGESIHNLNDYLRSEKNVVILDSNVLHFHGHHFSAFDTIEIDPGEQNKTLETVERIYRYFLERELDQSSFIIAIGGGFVRDVAGFAAATYKNGIGYGFIPSTFLAQVDASIGGTNGINFHGHKNLLGVFNQPEFVLCDTDLLLTLPEGEIASGLAELVKHSLIRSASLFELLEQEWASLLSLDKDTLEKVINDSVVIKSWIIQSDALKKGERKKLFFGHTLGQVIEEEGQKSHGEALSIGMVMASKISAAKGMISLEEVSHIISLLKKLRLPTEIISYKEILLETIKKNKKFHGNSLNFVLLSEIGKSEVVVMTYTELEEHIHNLYSGR